MHQLSLISSRGVRKYLTVQERAAFIYAAAQMDPAKGTFCLTLALTGARISEILFLTHRQLDQSDGTILIRSLKRRRKDVYRAVPVPDYLFSRLRMFHDADAFREDARLWSVSRTTAWKYVKEAMGAAKLPAALSKPKALRHAFAVEAMQKHIALSVIQKWLGHAKMETTAIYAEPVGKEERLLAQALWPTLTTPDA